MPLRAHDGQLVARPGDGKELACGPVRQRGIRGEAADGEGFRQKRESEGGHGCKGSLLPTWEQGIVVFNIKGNRYRVVVAVQYTYRLVYLRFVGTHQAYDKIDATTI
jgi:hypothetical protein